jgi:hypothetical protein
MKSILISLFLLGHFFINGSVHAEEKQALARLSAAQGRVFIDVTNIGVEKFSFNRQMPMLPGIGDITLRIFDGSEERKLEVMSDLIDMTRSMTVELLPGQSAGISLGNERIKQLFNLHDGCYKAFVEFKNHTVKKNGFPSLIKSNSIQLCIGK